MQRQSLILSGERDARSLLAFLATRLHPAMHLYMYINKCVYIYIYIYIYIYLYTHLFYQKTQQRASIGTRQDHPVKEHTVASNMIVAYRERRDFKWSRLRVSKERKRAGEARLNGVRAITKRWTRFCRSGIDEPSKESTRTVKPRQRRHISQAGLRVERHTTTSAGAHVATRPTFRKPAVHRWSRPV